MTDDELIEKMKAAISKAMCDDPPPDTHEIARAALTALREAGYEVRRTTE